MRIAMNDSDTTTQMVQALKPVETWLQDAVDPDLWHHASGIIVNTSALDERSHYYRVIRTSAPD